MNDAEERRPSPDALLEQAKLEQRGKLKIYLGAAPGVGKTYAMLSDARRKRADGVDIAAGVVETHGRAETKALLEGLEVIPKHMLGAPGRQIEEMDLDAILARKPKIALVDELAHSNAEGARHPKRWMDVDELLAAGIDVWSTLNVQHIESLNDIVARITRVRVRETLPDAVLERADEVELVDLTPDELIERLREGKIYLPDQAQLALRNYFAPGNLSALRELAMRRAADRIDEQVRGLRQAQGETAPWAAGERILVCVDEREASPEVVRHAKRRADQAHAQWLAVHVETGRGASIGERQRARLSETLRLAERLGAETATLPGDRVADTLLAYAREQNVTQIIVGKARRSLLFETVFGSVVRELINRSGSIAIEVVPEDAAHSQKTRISLMAPWPALTSRGVAEAIVMTAAATLVAWPLDKWLAVSNLTLVYLAAVLVSALTRGLWAGLLTGIASALAFNWFYTAPRHTFTIADPDNVLAILAFTGAALVISALAARARQQTLAARSEARTSRELFGLSRMLTSATSEDEAASALARYAARAFEAECAVLARIGLEDIRQASTFAMKRELTESDWAAARWTLQKGEATGRGADTLPGVRWLFLPLRTKRLVAGVVGVARETPLSPAERRRLEGMGDQAASAMERAHVAEALEHSRIETEAERLRGTMLASLSHDLKTPIAGVLGAASSLRAYGDRHDPETRDGLLSSIENEAARMQRYVGKLLDMTRLDAGGIQARAEPLDPADALSAVASRAGKLSANRPIRLDIESNLPLVRADASLLDQALFNLFENALIHAKQGPVTLKASRTPAGLALEVLDEGPGLKPGEEQRIFDRFTRGSEPGDGGTGLGLAIVKGFAGLMNAKVSARNRTDGTGAVFAMEFPGDTLVQ
ncbi:MAG TPA: sensor histidine kinase KdpD [Hyphomonadaceae bacterium]|nr:sensor histidine kinase KdpD [Hyphomonadaceae bacterium]